MVIFLESEGVVNRAVIFAALGLHNEVFKKNWRFVGSLDQFSLGESLNLKETLKASPKETVIVCDSPVGKLADATEETAKEIRKALRSRKKHIIIHVPETDPISPTGRMELVKKFKIPVTEIPGEDPREVAKNLLEFVTGKA